MGNTTMSEFRLFDTPGAEIAKIVTDGATIKPFLNAINVVNDEVKLRVTPDGLKVTVNDPGNVFITHAELPGSAFERYELNTEGVIGVAVPELQSAVRRARKNSDDTLTLSIRDHELTATVERGYGEHDVVSQSTLSLIDPDSVREEPNLPSIEYGLSISLAYDAFMDALGYGLEAAKHVWIETKPVNQHGSALYIGAETDIRSEHAAISGIETDAAVESKYSVNYMSDLRQGLKEVNTEAVNIRTDTEYPFEATAKSDTLAVTYAVAPRIQSE
jgi:DNA polymerase III sliding clamp (beta) subunit (PCNA family)